MDESVFDPDLSAGSGAEEAVQMEESAGIQLGKDGAGGESPGESGEESVASEDLEALENQPVPLYDPDEAHSEDGSFKCDTPPDQSFKSDEKEEMGDPSKLSSIGGFFSDDEEEPEPRFPPGYYDVKLAEGQDPEDFAPEEPNHMEEEDEEEAMVEAAIEAAEAELAAQVEEQQRAEAHAGGAELLRQVSGQPGAVKDASVPLVRAPDSSSREPDFVEDPVVPKVEGYVEFERLPPVRVGGNHLLGYRGFKYSVSKPANVDKPVEQQRWRFRCSQHASTGCKVHFFVSGEDKLLDNPSLLDSHTCSRPDHVEVCRDKIRGAIRAMVAESFEEGHYFRFNVKAKELYARLEKEVVEGAQWTVVDVQDYAYSHSRWILKLPTPPSTIHFDWPSDDKFLMRDPGFEGVKRSVLLHDSKVFQFKPKTRGPEKDGRFCVFGMEYIRRYAEMGVLDGALIDGIYHCAPKGFAQMFNILFRLVLKRDAAGKPCRVVWIHGLSAALSSHDHGLYVRFFEWLKVWMGEWEPCYVASDFEIAATAAFRSVWAHACQISCRFHLSKGIRDRVIKHGFMEEFIGDARSRRMLRFILGVAYLPSEEVAREVLEKFYLVCKPKAGEEDKPFFKEILPYLKAVFIGDVIQPSVPANGDKPAVPAKWSKHRYSIKSWLRHDPALNSWPTSTNPIESFHRLIKRSSGPRPGLWNFVDLMGHILELTRGRLRVIDCLLEKEGLAGELDGMLDSYGVEMEVEEGEEELCASGDVELADLSLVKVKGKRPTKKIRWVRGCSETSASVLKKKPLAQEYVQARVGAEEVLKSGYLPLDVARRDMDLPFLCLEEGVRKWPAYQGSLDLKYLYVRKMGCLISGFGTPKPSRMSRVETKMFKEQFAQWSAYEADFAGEEDDGEDDGSDTEGVAGQAVQEFQSKKRRESLANGVEEDKGDGEVVPKRAGAKKLGKGSKPSASKKPSSKGAKVSVSKKPSAKKPSKSAKGAGKKMDSSKTDILAKSSSGYDKGGESDSDDEALLVSYKRRSGETSGEPFEKVSRGEEAGTSGLAKEGGGSGEGVLDEAAVAAPAKTKKKRKSVDKFSPKNLRSKSKFSAVPKK